MPLDLESWDHHGASWSPDGNWVAYHRFHTAKWDLVKAPLVGGKVVHLGEAAAGGGPTAWSPTGEWVAAWTRDGFPLLSSDGTDQQPLDDAFPPGFEFSRDGSLLYAIRRGNQELVTLDVHTAHPKRAVTLPVPLSSTLTGFSLHPDGKSFITSVGTGPCDIWLLEGNPNQFARSIHAKFFRRSGAAQESRLFRNESPMAATERASSPRRGRSRPTALVYPGQVG